LNTAHLIAVTQPEQDLSVEEFIVYCARVSNPANQSNHATAPKLMRYLIEHGHWSPFEMVSITMEITTTRDIARQILRHRSFSFQEFSQRYADPTEALGFSFREARLQDKANRQNSIVASSEDDDIRGRWITMQYIAMNEAEKRYKEALVMGIAKEQARALLPEGLTVSRLYMAGTLRSWLHYCNVRTKADTQAEHRQVADSAWQIIVELCPSLEGLNDTK
jgi:thymidylate synthase (FAD)